MKLGLTLFYKCSELMKAAAKRGGNLKTNHLRRNPFSHDEFPSPKLLLPQFLRILMKATFFYIYITPIDKKNQRFTDYFDRLIWCNQCQIN